MVGICGGHNDEFQSLTSVRLKKKIKERMDFLLTASEGRYGDKSNQDEERNFHAQFSKQKLNIKIIFRTV